MGRSAQLANMSGAPAFSAYAGAATSLLATAYTKVAFNTEEFDTNSCFASSRFTPTVAGYYQINCAVQIVGAILGSVLVIYKNGAAYKASQYAGATQNDPMKSLSGLVYLNGSTDYVEVYAYNGGVTAFNTVAGSSVTWFDGYLVRAA